MLGLVAGAAQGLVQGGIDQIFAGANARRDWQYKQKEMALQQQYALEQMEKQSELSYNQWQKQFDYENSYNDPSQVLSRYSVAGVNPAAVLGSSGVAVQGTMSGGSAPSPAGGMPHASGGYGSGPYGGKVDPVAYSQAQMNKSATDRNAAAAELDRAQAQDIQNKMQPKEYYADIAELNKQITENQVSDSKAVAKMNSALATLYQSDAEFAELSSTYKFQDLVAQYSRHVEEYNQIRKYNVQFMDRVLGAQITLDLARAYQAQESGDLASAETEVSQLRLSDMRNWFEVNWETKIPVPQVDSKGKPTGKSVELTGREIQAYLLGLDVTHGNQESASRWFSTRSEKNAFGYQLVNTVVHGAMGIAGAATLGKVGASTMRTYNQSSTYDSQGRTVKRYDSKGNLLEMITDDRTGTSSFTGVKRTSHPRK